MNFFNKKYLVVEKTLRIFSQTTRNALGGFFPRLCNEPRLFTL